MPNLLKVLTAVSIMVTVAAAQMQLVVKDDKGEGGIDWSQRTIVAKGIGAPNPDVPEAAQRAGAERAATIIALRNALEAVKGIYLNSSTTVQNFMTTSDVVTTQVNGYIKGFEQKGRTKYMSDGSVEITMEIPLDGIGAVGDLLMGGSIGDSPAKTSFEGKGAKEEVIFSGLIIDARGLKVKPALSPKILDPEGKEIYGSAYVSKEWAVKYGIVGYSKSVQDAAKLKRVGEKPGTIKAIEASGQNNTDIVLSKKDAESVRSAAENLKFLSQCRVIVVVD